MSSTDRGLRLTLHAIRRQLAAMPHELYLIRLIHNTTHRAFPGERLWTAPQLLNPSTVKFLRIRNRDGCDVYLLPYAGNHNAGYILVDLDRADATVLLRMQENEHHPCVVLQTSPGHLQAWIHVSTSLLEPRIATAIARQLAREYHADPASADGRHLGRLAGFTNQKPARRSVYGYAPWVKIVHTCPGLAPKADQLLHSALNIRPPVPTATDIPLGFQSGPISAATATAIYQHYVSRWSITQRFSPPDWSIVDLWIARRLLSQGMLATHAESVVRLGSPQFPRRHGDPARYLRRTIARAAFSLPPKGASV